MIAAFLLVFARPKYSGDPLRIWKPVVELKKKELPAE
jgi:hypothetical protein